MPVSSEDAVCLVRILNRLLLISEVFQLIILSSAYSPPVRWRQHIFLLQELMKPFLNRKIIKVWNLSKIQTRAFPEDMILKKLFQNNWINALFELKIYNHFATVCFCFELALCISQGSTFLSYKYHHLPASVITAFPRSKTEKSPFLCAPKWGCESLPSFAYKIWVHFVEPAWNKIWCSLFF